MRSVYAPEGNRMLHYRKDDVKKLLLTGEIGLEKENLRVTGDGHLAQSPDPFYGEKHIVKDFSESQVEINTDPWPETEQAVAELAKDTRYVREYIGKKAEPEYLWPFSNPPYLDEPESVPIAQYIGEDHSKTIYREYLAKKYGTFLMTFCGIHLNFSFSEELLKTDFSYSGCDDFRQYRDSVYLDLAEQMLRYGWIMNILTSASPVLDGSYFQKDNRGKDVVTDYASVRCGEHGYWNTFVPVLDYSSTNAYVDSIASYVKNGLLQAPSELYFPIRLKAGTKYTLDHLRTGWTHIELRTVDLNPFVPEGLDARDVKFARLLMIFLACTKDTVLSDEEKIRGADNFKHAAHLYPERERVLSDDGREISMTDLAGSVITDMQKFYRDLDFPVQDILDFELEKIEQPEKRYAFQVLDRFSDGFVEKGLVYAKQLS